MATPTLEQRVAELERQVVELQSAVKNGGQVQDWRSTVGMFSGDEVMKRICAAALAYREADRERARRRFAKADRAKARRVAK